MEKVTLSIFECKPGMRIAQTLYNNYGAVMIVKDTILDKQILDRIESMGMLEVEVFIQDNEIIKDNYHKNVQEKYEQNISDMKELMSKVRRGVPLDMPKVRKITDTISSGVYSITDIMGSLSQVGDVGQYNYTHSINVSFIAMTIGKWMNCSERTIKHLTQAGLLHDIGKSRIPNDIMDKPEKLTKQEFDIVKQHPKYSYDILKEISSIHNDVLLGVLTHHEREDGSGYPTGMTSEKINLIAKILAVADIYDAMASERIYRKSQTPFEAFELMQNGSFGKLHPVILNRFIKNMGEHYNGARVALNNGEEGEVVFINARNISKPIVKTAEKYIDLSLEKKLKIVAVLKNDNLSS